MQHVKNKLEIPYWKNRVEVSGYPCCTWQKNPQWWWRNGKSDLEKIRSILHDTQDVPEWVVEVQKALAASPAALRLILRDSTRPCQDRLIRGNPELWRSFKEQEEVVHCELCEEWQYDEARIISGEKDCSNYCCYPCYRKFNPGAPRRFPKEKKLEALQDCTCAACKKAKQPRAKKYKSSKQ